MIRANWRTAVKAWEQEGDRAKVLGKRPSWKKPVLKGQLFSAVPKPQFIGNNDPDTRAVAGPSNQTRADVSDKSSDSDSSDSDSGSSDSDSESYLTSNSL